MKFIQHPETVVFNRLAGCQQALALGVGRGFRSFSSAGLAAQEILFRRNYRLWKKSIAS
jgi:hypothetical protein